MKPPFTYLEFFAGGGMARLGLGDSWRRALANDIDSQKCAAYRANFGGDGLVEGDIAEIGASVVPGERPDLMWGSFPCQDLSLAGLRGGIKAKRSGLFYAFERIARELHAEGRAPKMIALENVTGLLTSDGGNDFAAVAGALAALDYRVSALVLDAADFTPQSRPRLFILGFANDTAPPTSNEPSKKTAPHALISAVANLDDETRKRFVWLAPAPRRIRNASLGDIIDWNAEDWRTRKETRALIAMMSPVQRSRLDALVKSGARRAGAGFRRTRIENGETVQRFEARFDGVAGCLRTPAGGSSRQIIVAVDKGAVRTRLMSPREAARLMGLPEDYMLPASTTAALKLCGDGVCVPVVSWLAGAVFEPALAPAWSSYAVNAA